MFSLYQNKRVFDTFMSFRLFVAPTVQAFADTVAFSDPARVNVVRKAQLAPKTLSNRNAAYASRGQLMHARKCFLRLHAYES
jgi:hypothetical protein